MNDYYKDYSEYLSEIFPGKKVQKISVNAGFSCPNRDGTIGRGGCIYCDNSSFTPGYCFDVNGIRKQVEAGKEFFRKKYPQMSFLVYFQSYTNTFAKGGVAELRRMYEESLDVEGVVGLIVGTRPDQLPDEVLDLLSELGERVPVFVELGAETTFDSTLQLINRGHTYHQTEEAVGKLADRGIRIGLHLICGLPGENEEMILETVKKVSGLPVESLKFHHLQVLEGTPLYQMASQKTIVVPKFSLEEYIDLCCKIVKLVPRRIAIERFLASSPPAKVVSPKWGIKNYEFTNLLNNKLKKNKIKSHE